MTRELRADFAVGATSIGLIGACFYGAYALMQIPSGWLIDRFGVRKVFSHAAALTGFSVILFACTPYFKVSLFARVLMGMGLSCAFIGNYYLAARFIYHRYFSLAAAFLHMFGSIGAYLAQGPLATMVNLWGWRTPMLATGAMMLVMAVLFALILRNGRPYVSCKADENKTASPSVIDSIKYVAKHPQIKWIALCGFMGWLPLSVLGALWGVPYFMRVYHLSNVDASSMFSFFWFGSAIGGVVLSFFSEYFLTRKKPILICFYGEFIVAIIMICAPWLSIWVLDTALFFLGIFVCMQTLSFALIKETVDPKFFAMASGANNTGAMLSSAIGQHIFGFFLDLQTTQHHVYETIYFQKALFIFLVASLTGIFVCQRKIQETNCCVREY